ncbi:hypothetical protein BKA70DRAFT_1228191 [Coprinopsis sp. MPI-PUGE-AT-0042]|nr:hypothetical protein BKA70DRAFT_1228191 [Coprinopsis sp. MPI-PUGE-AT-0042]
MPRTTQISPRCALVRAFLDKVELAHRAVTSGSPRQILHYDSTTKSLVPWYWPVYNEEMVQPEKLGLRNTRVEPSGLEEYRRYHEFRAPSCLCAFVNGVEYTESRIGVVSGGKQGGAYAAECEERHVGIVVLLQAVKNTDAKITIHAESPLDATPIVIALDEGKDKVVCHQHLDPSTSLLVAGTSLERNPLMLVSDLLKDDGVDARIFWTVFRMHEVEGHSGDKTGSMNATQFDKQVLILKDFGIRRGREFLNSDWFNFLRAIKDAGRDDELEQVTMNQPTTNARPLTLQVLDRGCPNLESPTGCLNVQEVFGDCRNLRNLLVELGSVSQ